MDPVRAAFDGGAGRDRLSVRICAVRLVVAAHYAYPMWPLEMYRSCHTGTDSKSVGANAHVGSNPTLSANHASISMAVNIGGLGTTWRERKRPYLWGSILRSA